MLSRSPISPRKQLLLGGAAILLLAIGLYGRTLGLPLIYDTLLHIRITKELNWGSVWLPAGSFGFYRPFTFAPLLLIKGIWGYYPGPLLHGINVLTHAVNGVLLMLLAWRLWGRPVLAIMSGLLLVVYPFSYQATAVYGHNVHPAITNLLLVGLLLYLAARQNWHGRRRLWWGLTALVGLKALLTHESAILFGVFAGLVHIQSSGSGDWLADLRQQLRFLGEASLRFGRENRPWLLLLGGGIVYFFIYQFLPLSRAPQAAETTGGGLGFKLMYVAQAVAHPLAALLYGTDWLGPIAIVIVAFLILLWLTAWSGRSPANRWPLFTGWVWFGLAALLVALPLPTGYLLNGPRLLYLSSIGTALLWPWLLEPLWRRRPWGSLVWVGLLLAIAVSNVRFVSGRLSAYANLTSPIRPFAGGPGRPTGDRRRDAGQSTQLDRAGRENLPGRGRICSHDGRLPFRRGVGGGQCGGRRQAGLGRRRARHPAGPRLRLHRPRPEQHRRPVYRLESDGRPRHHQLL